ncbi:MAG: hypothetical protein ACYTG6_15295, partial [Planctomycetota bacterium]
ESLGKELGALGQSLAARLSDLDERSNTATREVRQQLLDQSKSLRDEILRAEEALAQARARAFEELQSQKVDRAALADLFNEVGMRLNNEFGLPSTD